MMNDLIKLFDETVLFGEDMDKMPVMHKENHRTMATDITETDDMFVIHGDLPGVPKENINIELENGVLTVSAHYEEKKEEKEGEKVVLQERSRASYCRQFQLPKDEGYDKENITAKFENGVLEVKIPKIEPQKNVSKIEIK